MAPESKLENDTNEKNLNRLHFENCSSLGENGVGFPPPL
jgi:hypothetical protein